MDSAALTVRRCHWLGGVAGRLLVFMQPQSHRFHQFNLVGNRDWTLVSVTRAPPSLWTIGGADQESGSKALSDPTATWLLITLSKGLSPILRNGTNKFKKSEYEEV